MPKVGIETPQTAHLRGFVVVHVGLALSFLPIGIIAYVEIIRNMRNNDFLSYENSNFGAELNWRAYNTMSKAIQAEWESFENNKLYNILVMLYGGAPYILTISREGELVYGYYKYYNSKSMVFFNRYDNIWNFETAVTSSDLTNIPTFLNQNELRNITFQVYKDSNNISYLQAILNIAGELKALTIKQL